MAGPRSGPSVWDSARTIGRGAEAQRLRELLAIAADTSVLDVGGGSGAFTRRFALGAGRVVVLDPGVERPSTPGEPRGAVEYRRGSGESIPLPDVSMDRVTAIRSTHHMESPESFLREAARVLRPGGWLVLEELRPGTGVARLFAATAHRHHGAPLDLRGPPEWSASLTAAGFSDVRSEVGRRWFYVVGVRPPAP